MTARSWCTKGLLQSKRVYKENGKFNVYINVSELERMRDEYREMWRAQDEADEPTPYGLKPFKRRIGSGVDYWTDKTVMRANGGWSFEDKRKMVSILTRLKNAK